MHRRHHKITHHTIVYSFLTVALLLITYSFSATGEEGRFSFKNRLNEPLLKGKSTAQSSVSFSYLSRNGDIPEPPVSAVSALVWDSASSTPLWDKNSIERRPIASITKLVTAAVVVNNSKMDEPVVVSDLAVMAEGTAGDLQPGEALTVETLLKAMLLESSNDAAMALSEHVEEYTGKNFVSEMNTTAQSFGMKDTYLADPAGLIDAHSTAKDLAALLDKLRTTQHYEPIWETLGYSSLTEFSSDGGFVHSFENTNPFLNELSGVIGGKTGFTNAAGESMVLVAKSPDGSRELYYIVLGSSDRFGDMRTLISWVGSAYVWEQK